MKAPEHSSEIKYPEYSSDQVIESKHSIIKKEKQIDLRNITHSYRHNCSNDIAPTYCWADYLTVKLSELKLWSRCS